MKLEEESLRVTTISVDNKEVSAEKDGQKSDGEMMTEDIKLQGEEISEQSDDDVNCYTDKGESMQFLFML